jgi:hypothetical protein
MKKSEFKEYLKNEVLKMTEASDEDIAKQQELNKELEKTKELMGSMEEANYPTAEIELRRLGIDYIKGDENKPIKKVYKPIDMDDDFYRKFDDVVFRYGIPKEDVVTVTEGEGSTITLDKEDMDKLHKNGKLDINNHTVLYKMKEGKMKKSEFKEYLKNEILREMNEQEEEEIELGDLGGEEEIEATIEEPQQDKALELDDIGDTLVQLAKRAKDVDERDLATQILNSAKFAKKTEFKKVEKDAGIDDEGE